MDTKEQASQPALQTLKEYAVITAAVLIMDIGIYVFKFPNNFSFGGVSGMAVVICRFLPFTASQINLFINLLLLLVGFAVLGRNFGVKTAYVTVLSSVLLNIFEKLFPMAHPLTDEIMLELCFAIILPALAAALLFFENASGGGTDIIAMIIKKIFYNEYFHCPAGDRPHRCHPCFPDFRYLNRTLFGSRSDGENTAD